MDRSILSGYKDDTNELLLPDIKFGQQGYGIATKKGCDFSQTCEEVVQRVPGQRMARRGS